MGSIERIDPLTHSNDLMYPEHLGRYMFASQITNNKKVIDCSSGNGYGSFYLAASGAANVIGIDIAEDAIAYCKQHYVKENLSYRLGDIRNLNWIPDQSVDVFICFETIEHVHETDKLLSEISRVLSANGFLIISCPNDYIFEPDNPFHVKRYRSTEFKDLVSRFFPQTKIFVQNNTLGTSVYSSEDIQAADVYQPSISANSHPLQSKELENADTWLLVCAKENVELPIIKPTVSFFTGYSDYIKEIQQTINDLYRENQSLADGWENQKKYIKQSEQSQEELHKQIESLSQENVKLSEAWQTHVDYIGKLEKQITEQQIELTKLANAWNQHDTYIKELEQKVREK